MTDLTPSPLDSSPAEPAPRRRWRYSLRALLAAMLLIGALLGWTMHKVREQRIAITALEKLGCRVKCGIRSRPGASWVVRPEAETLLQRLRRWLGEDSQEVLYIWGDESQLDDAALKLVGKFSQLDMLRIRETHVSDAGLAHLAGLVELEWLDATRTGLTDAGLRHLDGMSRLSFLSLGGTRVGDDGLVHLAGLVQMTELDLTNTAVSDAGLVHLIELENLYRLDLSGTNLTDAGLVHLSKLKSLRYLYLQNTSVTEPAVRKLGQELQNTLIYY